MLNFYTSPLYFKCTKSDQPKDNFRLCVGRELKSDRSGLRQDFERRWKEQQTFLRLKDESLSARKCQVSHLEFRKTKNQDLWSVFSCSNKSFAGLFFASGILPFIG